MLNDIPHNLSEGLEWYTIPGWWRLRLETNFGDNEWLCDDGSKYLRQRTKDYRSQYLDGT
jgi:hypothetical protein